MIRAEKRPGSTRTCTANDSHQNGFGLIVFRVCSGNLVCKAIAAKSREPLMPQFPRSRFQTQLVLPRVGWDIG